MKTMQLSMAVLVFTPAALAADWKWVSSNDLCAGVQKTCDSKESCSSFAIGPCAGENQVATNYMASHFVGMGFVDENKYLDCTTSSCADAKLMEASGIGYRDGQTVADGNKKYSFGMAGNIFGDMNVAGGYLGVAHYLNTGSVDISTNTNEVYVANAEKSGRVDRSSDGGSKWGAPSGPHTVCISKVQTDGTCGPDRAFKPSEYKFSIFGHVSGKNFSTNVVPGKNGFPVGLSHVAVRMKLKAVGFKASDLQVNKRPYDAAKISEDVTSFSFSHKKGSLAYEFPTEYNVGTVAGAKTDGTLMDVSATKTVKIKVHSPKSADQSILVDYLFETSGLIEGSYFIYDPTVSTYAAAMDDGEKSGATSARTSGAAATMLLGMLPSLVAAMLAYHH